MLWMIHCILSCLLSVYLFMRRSCNDVFIPTLVLFLLCMMYPTDKSTLFVSHSEDVFNLGSHEVFSAFSCR